MTELLFGIYPFTVPAAIIIAALTRKDLALMSALTIVGCEIAYYSAPTGDDVVVAWAVMNMLLAVVAAHHYNATLNKLALVVVWLATAGVANVLAMAIMSTNPIGLAIAQHIGGILTIVLLVALVFMDGRRDFIQGHLDSLRRHMPADSIRARQESNR